MYSLIAWNSKDGVVLKREELDVQSTKKLTVMNGEKMEPGATVNMLFKKHIWGGKIKSLHASRKSAEEEVDETLRESCEREEEIEEVETSNTSKRNRKRKSYREDFEEMVDDEKTTNEESDASNHSPTVKEKSGSAKKSKKSANARGGTTEAPKTARELRKNISSQHDELVVSEILGACPTPEPQYDELVVSEILGVCPISEPSQLKSVHPTKHPHFGGKQPKQHRPKCIGAICREEKEELKEELKDTKEELAHTKKELANALQELRELKALQPTPNSSGDLQENVEYGKLSRSVGQANNWKEISNGVWCCPIKVKAAIKNASTRTGLACALLAIFYPKEKLQGQCLHELDQDMIEAITDFSMVARLTKEPKPRKTKDGEDRKPAQSPLSRSGIKQAMRMTCNTIISLQKKKGCKRS